MKVEFPENRTIKKFSFELQHIPTHKLVFFLREIFPGTLWKIGRLDDTDVSIVLLAMESLNFSQKYPAGFTNLSSHLVSLPKNRIKSIALNFQSFYIVMKTTECRFNPAPQFNSRLHFVLQVVRPKTGHLNVQQVKLWFCFLKPNVGN